MDQPNLDRNLLYGILAIQVDLIDTDKFVSAIVPPPVLSDNLPEIVRLVSAPVDPPDRIDPENRHDRHVETRSAALTRRRTAQPRR
jgi:hypothetical protein